MTRTLPSAARAARTRRAGRAPLTATLVVLAFGAGFAPTAGAFAHTSTAPNPGATATAAALGPATATPNAATTATAAAAAAPSSGTAAPAPTTPSPAPTTTPAPTTPEVPAAAAPTGTATRDADGSLIPTAATKSVSYAARLVVPVTVRSKPTRQSSKVTGLKPFGSWNGGPVVLQIAEVRMVGDVRWLRVRLPIRPNGATGWVPQSSVEVMKLRYRILISRSQHLLTVYRDGVRVKSTRVVVGAPGTPTPRGAFAVLEVVRQPKGEDIGPWALHLTAHSDVLENFGGGPGRVAMHGRAGDLLSDPLGSSRSHGCIRMSNAFISYLHTVATEGTPVQIT